MRAVMPLHTCQVFTSPWAGVYGVRTHSARSFGRHSHATYGIGWLQHGAQSSASGHGQVDAYAGDLITCNPEEVHDGRPLGGGARCWHIVHLEPTVIDAMLGPGAAKNQVALVRPVLQDSQLRTALGQLLQSMARWSVDTRATDVDALACEEALAQTCSLLLARHATAVIQCPESPEAASMTRVRERLADELLAPPSLAQLAEMVNLSRYQVLRRFTQVVGMPPHAWLLQQRAERARRLIRDGQNLADAALAAGFADQSHMTRIFSRQFGFTPGAWRRARCNNVQDPYP